MRRLLLLCLTSFVTTQSFAVEFAELTPDTWEDFAPAGKEVDCIYGDFVLRNEHLIAVIARPAAGRNANMTVRNVAGALIDLTRRDEPNDQLSAYYPCAGRYSFFSTDQMQIMVDGQVIAADSKGPLEGKTIAVVCSADSQDGKISVDVRYLLADGQPSIRVETVYKNAGTMPVKVDLADSIRADRTFTFGDDRSGLFWAYDPWFDQAYGVVAEGFQIRRGGGRGPVLQFLKNNQIGVSIPAASQFVLRRDLIPAADLLQVKSIANRMLAAHSKPIELTVRDALGPVRHAKVTVSIGDQPYAWGRTPADGKMSFALPDGKYNLAVEALGRPTKQLVVDTAMSIESLKAAAYEIELDACGFVEASISDEQGQPIPCKVAFHGKGDTPTPFFAPDSAAVAVHNLHYSHNGRFRQELGPGQYDVIISRGPEYDAVFQELVIRRGETTRLTATLVRTVDTTGWVSADFHSHSSPSGDNTGSQLGRVLNLLAEHIEFAPCTEHNRIDSYAPHLARLDAEAWMATCTGIELTGSPLPINHQNAFPLIRKPRTQDGGGPLTNSNPLVQIERLAMWDGNSDKLVQGNHPNLVQMLGDKDLNGKYDGGFEGMFSYMDVVEVHPPIGIFTPPEAEPSGRLSRNPIFHWMQMLNMGYRITGVVNTDAHYNYHGSGWLRNYIRSPTDQPAEIDTMQIVHASESGRVVMSNGPFLEVTLESNAGEPKVAHPGDSAVAVGGEASLNVRVQCPNWLDINRVQVFLNGRPDEKLNFTRRTHRDRFANGTVKFKQKIPLKLDVDTHVIVAVVGEGLQLGRVMGQRWGKKAPIAVANPIFVDVDNNGFKPNGDRLGVPIPLPIK